MYEPDTLDSTTKNKLDYIKQVKECIKKIWARGTRNQQEFYAKDWTVRYSRIIDDCLNAFEEPKVCARMMYIKYHKENPLTRDLNKNHDTDFHTLLKEAKQYFDGLKKWKDDNGLLNKLAERTTASTGDNMKCALDKNSRNLLLSIGFEFRPSHDDDGESLDAYRNNKGKYEWIACLGKQSTDGCEYYYRISKNKNDMLLGKYSKEVCFKNKKELLDYFKLKAESSTVFALSEDRLDNSTKALYETMNEGSFQYNYRISDDFKKFLNTTMLDEIKDVIRSDKNLIKKCVEKRVQSHSIVWDALVRIFVYVIKQHNLRVKLSTDKIKNWFAFNNTDYKTALQPLIKDIDDFRSELRETEK